MLTPATTIVDRIRAMAQSQPDHPALIQAAAAGCTEQVSYAELMQRVDQARVRLDSSRLQAYDRCGVQGGNTAEFIVQALAVIDASLCLVPIAEDYDAAALESFVARCKLHGLIECDAASGIQVFENPGAVDDQQDEAFRQLEPTFIRFTSGTTNQRKGVVVGRQAVMDRVEAGNRSLQIGSEDRVLWMLPMAHHFLVSILLYLRHGATILLPGEDAAHLVRFANEQKATVIYASPDHYQYLLTADEGELPSTLRLVLSTSMGLSETLVNDFARRFGVHLTQALGIIEVGLPVVNIAHAVSKPLALGQVQPDFKVTLKTHEGDEISRLGSDSGVGEVCISGPGLFDAYLSPWIPAAEILSDEGFRTGDLGYFDEDHDLYLLGRRQNRINIGGRKFFCEEVEAVLNAYSGIAESRVRSEKVNDKLRVVADVVTTNGSVLNTGQLQQFCQEKLNRYKIPEQFIKVAELDKTATGKIRRW